MPAIRERPIEMLVSTQKMMMGMLGGMSESSAPEAVMHPIERLLS